MKVDFYTKAVLTVIAVALSIIALSPWIAPHLAIGSPDIASDVSEIEHRVRRISRGLCSNSKIC